jgi:hypothetical protein
MKIRNVWRSRPQNLAVSACSSLAITFSCKGDNFCYISVKNCDEVYFVHRPWACCKKHVTLRTIEFVLTCYCGIWVKELQTSMKTSSYQIYSYISVHTCPCDVITGAGYLSNYNIMCTQLFAVSVSTIESKGLRVPLIMRFVMWIRGYSPMLMVIHLVTVCAEVLPWVTTE